MKANAIRTPGRWDAVPKIAGVLLCAMLALLVTAPAPAQSIFATLKGTVSDSSQAVVPGANITVKNVRSGDIRKTVTNEQGFFTLPSLPAGTYIVTAEMAGFAKWEGKDIVLNSSDSRTMNIVLSVAQTTVQVEVTAGAPELAMVDSGEKSALISNKELQELSLVSRNAGEYIKILPGAVMASNMGVNRAAYTGETIGINGSGMSGNQGSLSSAKINGQLVDITQDGGHTFDPGAPGAATPVNPNADMIQEVKVLTSNFSAENAKGPVIVNFVSKSGGRDFHGEGYFYTRHSELNANDWFNNYSGAEKPPSAYYYPGGNIGGPVLIPGTGFNRGRDKLFFFQGFEYYKQNIDGGVMRAFVMDDNMFNGDFSGVDKMGVKQALLGVVPSISAGDWVGLKPGCTITGGKLSAACIDPGAKTLLRAYLPQPNVDAKTHDGYNYVKSFSVPQNSYQSLTRADWNISDNTKVFVRYNRQRESQNQPTGLWGGRGSDNMVPSPSNIIGDNASESVAASFMHVFSPSMTSETTFAWTYIDFPNRPEDPSKLLRQEMNFPYKGIYGNGQAPALVTWNSTFPNLGAVGHNYHPTMICMKGIPSLSHNMAKVMGTHTTKFGFYWEHVYNEQDNWGQYSGSIGYNAWSPSISGNNYADALMAIGFADYFEQALPPPGNISQNMAAFYIQDAWKVNRRLTLEYGIRFEHVGKPYDGVGFGMAIFDAARYSDALADRDKNTGLFWHGMDNSVPMSGSESRFLFFSPRFGMAYDLFGNGRTIIRGGWGKYRAYAGLQSNVYTQPAGTSAGSVSFWCGFNDPRCPDWAGIDKNAIAAPAFGTGPGPGLKGINVSDPKNDEIPLVTSYSFSINQRLPAKFNAEISYVGNQGKFLEQMVDINAVPWGSMAGETGNTNEDKFRPRHNYQAINMGKPMGRTQFDSLQASLRRSMGFLTLQGNYTWSKGLGAGYNDQTRSGVFSDYGLHYFWGVVPDTRAHTLSMAYVFTLPEPKSNPFVRAVLGGWQISGITQVTSGSNLTSQDWNLNYSQADANNVTRYGTTGLDLHPLITCDPRKGVKEHQYVNPACFTGVPVGQLGTGGMAYIPGPKFFNSDLSFLKNFRVNERQRLQLRFQMFNFLNHPLESFTNADNNLKLNIDAAGKVANANTFGVAQYKFGHRIIELAIKYSF